MKMFGEPETLDEAIVYAKRLIKRLCCYGGGRRCDCKYLPDDYQRRMVGGTYPRLNGEQTGCCEARALLNLLEESKKQEEKYEEQRKQVREQSQVIRSAKEEIRILKEGLTRLDGMVK
jgi:hypothetical protein